jgi:hypothetical protein
VSSLKGKDKMIKVKSYPDKQRLDIIADQSLNKADFKAIISDVKSEATQLKKGFVVAVDFRGMWVEDPLLNAHFKMLQEALLKIGASKIGTLLDNPAVHMRLAQEGQKTNSNQITRRFHDEKKWEEFLAIPMQ